MPRYQDELSLNDSDDLAGLVEVWHQLGMETENHLSVDPNLGIEGKGVVTESYIGFVKGLSVRVSESVTYDPVWPFREERSYQLKVSSGGNIIGEHQNYEDEQIDSLYHRAKDSFYDLQGKPGQRSTKRNSALKKARRIIEENLEGGGSL
jgi:hypothetical protein